MNYGLPYMGSKNKIAEWVLEQLPEAENLYDLFGGGGAITHCAATQGKYQNIYYNDIQKNLTKLFKDAIEGKYADEKRWISREEFFDKKNKNDMYIKTCWSFGNKCSAYMYSKEIEPWKKATHYAIVFKDYSLFADMDIIIKLKKETINERRLEFRKLVKENSNEYKEKYIHWYLKNILKKTEKEIEKLKNITEEDKEKEKKRLQKLLRDALDKSDVTASKIDKLTNTQMAGHWFGTSQWAFPTFEYYTILQTVLDLPDDYYEVINYYNVLTKDLQSLESLESLERLQDLQSLQRHIIYSEKSYKDIEIKENSIIYCDIPYRNTADYISDNFDYDAFYEWACSQSVPVYISEYSMPEDKFECIAEKEKNCNLNKKSNDKKRIEKIFIPKK